VATLTTFRRTLAPLLGVFEQGTADAGASSQSRLVCTTTLASGANLQSSSLPASLFNGKWLYLPGAALDDRSRLIKTEAGYDRITGALSPDRVWAVDPDDLADRTFEITSLFSGPDQNILVNEGLKRCWLVVESTFTVASPQTRRHSLAALTGLSDPRQVYRIGQLTTGLSRDEHSPYGRRSGDVYKDGGTVYLDRVSFATTETVYVTWIKPAYHHCAAAATPTVFTQTGLSAEGDVCPVDPYWVAWAAILAGMDRIEHLENTGQATTEARESRAMAAARFTARTAENFTPPERTYRPRPSIVGPRW
jgi:hypothetical protein